MAGLRKRAAKATCSGRGSAVQPRVRLTRSFDERSHSYLGYVLRNDGNCGGQSGGFLVAVGGAAHKKHRFEVGMKLSGYSVTVEDSRKETASLYKTRGIKVVKNVENKPSTDPRFYGVPPDLNTYRKRGHRRLDTRTYDTKCATCIWGCRMPVEMIIDQWNPSKKQYRFKTFCHGTKTRTFFPSRACVESSRSQGHILH
mgnify:CR=1 FL=1